MLESIPCNMILFSSTGCHTKHGVVTYEREDWRDVRLISWLNSELTELQCTWTWMKEGESQGNYQVKILKGETGRGNRKDFLCITAWEITVWRKTVYTITYKHTLHTYIRTHTCRSVATPLQAPLFWCLHKHLGSNYALCRQKEGSTALIFTSVGPAIHDPA